MTKTRLDQLETELAETLDTCDEHWKPFIAAHKKAKHLRKEIRKLRSLKETRYFVDSEGIIFSVYEDGTTNYPGKIQVNVEGIYTLDGNDLVTGEYDIHASLQKLCTTIET